jgi:flagellar hook-basal body complex protein FliE
MIEGIYQSRVSSLLDQIRESHDRAGLIRSDTAAKNVQSYSGREGFGTYIQNAVRSVSETQMDAADVRDAYERGEDIPLTDVVLAMQKSSLAFEATLQVRNKLLKAYEDIKSMPV